jgi:hypothetical protein
MPICKRSQTRVKRANVQTVTVMKTLENHQEGVALHLQVIATVEKTVMSDMEQFTMPKNVVK